MKLVKSSGRNWLHSKKGELVYLFNTTPHVKQPMKQKTHKLQNNIYTNSGSFTISMRE